MLTITYHDSTSVTNLDPLVCAVNISGDASQAARKMALTLQGTSDGVTRLVTLEKGCELRALSGSVEVFRGVIFSDAMDATGRLTLTAYDYNIYLTKNTDTRKFEKVTASTIIKTLCGAFGIPTGTIEDTGYVIPKMIFENKTLWDMMVMALTYTKKQTGVQYFIYSDAGKLCVGRFTKPTSRVVFEPGVNMTGVSRSTSIENVATQLRLYGTGKGNKAINVTVSDADLIKKYGIMQAFESPDETTTASAAAQKATALLNDMKTPSDDVKVECIDMDEVVAGSAIYLVAELVGATGGYYVAADSHTYDGDAHTMSLNLSKTDVLPVLEYDGETTTTTTKKTTTTSKASSSDAGVLGDIKGTDDSTIN
jgi:hypothetical protein